jgi:hypothetical protein
LKAPKFSLHNHVLKQSSRSPTSSNIHYLNFGHLDIIILYLALIVVIVFISLSRTAIRSYTGLLGILEGCGGWRWNVFSVWRTHCSGRGRAADWACTHIWLTCGLGKELVKCLDGLLRGLEGDVGASSSMSWGWLAAKRTACSFFSRGTLSHTITSPSISQIKTCSAHRQRSWSTRLIVLKIADHLWRIFFSGLGNDTNYWFHP